ncbi:N-acetyltransferase family protein [Sphingomonas sp. IW22]|uniref:GNAT family N-acetyltransferase n=1 Tax=Sphingomonas sp. IW22 TaxID=3242489 RepID=UPI003520F03C
MNTPPIGDFITTRTGNRFHVRPVVYQDDGTIRAFFSHVTRTDLRFRFLTGMNEIGPAQITMLTHPDASHAESYVVFTEDGGMMVASAMLTWNPALDRGEVAIAIRDDHKHKGLGWELLAYIARIAETKGIRTLQSIESRDNHEAIELERDMGFTVSEYPDDPTLVLVSRSIDRR